MTEFVYLTATDWGMDWTRPPIAEAMPDPEVYVHHTAGTVPHSDAGRYLQWLNQVAQDSKDYSALDYDIMVHRNWITGVTTIAEGRGPWLSAATRARNELGEAICVAGYFHPGKTYSRPPHPDEVEAVARGIVWGIDQGWIARDARILGHRDNPGNQYPHSTACPGDYLYAELPTIRARVAELLAPPPEDDVIAYAEIKDLWIAPGAADVADGGASDRWLNAIVLKVGAIADVQARNGLPVTGRYNQATAAAYAKELAAMKTAAGV